MILFMYLVIFSISLIITQISALKVVGRDKNAKVWGIIAIITNILFAIINLLIIIQIIKL